MGQEVARWGGTTTSAYGNLNLRSGGWVQYIARFREPGESNVVVATKITFCDM